MKLHLLPLALTGVALSTPAVAQTPDRGVYGAVGYAAEEVSDADAEFGSLQARLGYRLHRHFGVEAEVGYGVRSETPSFADVELGGQGAAYLVGFLPLTPQLDLFARVGAGVQDMSGEGVCIAVSVVPGPSVCSLPEADESLNYGVGATYYFDARNGVRADWTRKDYDDAGLEADVWSIAFQRRF
jgi:hypothetical protein